MKFLSYLVYTAILALPMSGHSSDDITYDVCTKFISHSGEVMLYDYSSRPHDTQLIPLNQAVADEFASIPKKIKETTLSGSYIGNICYSGSYVRGPLVDLKVSWQYVLVYAAKVY